MAPFQRLVDETLVDANLLRARAAVSGAYHNSRVNF